MTPKVEPIFLWGFCFTTQQELQFNQSWACAFHNSWYTDEGHSLWDSIDDPSKRREIRYGNNIYVLFRVLLHCRDFYGQDTLWTAIARGFNANGTFVRKTVEILTEARREQRDKPARDVPDTARAADDWIEFLDSRPSVPRVLSDPEVFKVADAFFKSQEKKHLNAARVPTNPHQTLSLNISRFTPRGPPAEGHTSPSVKLESPRDTADAYRTYPPTRKRSASLLSADREPKARRLHPDAREQPRSGPERMGERDEPPRIQPTRSPRRMSHSQQDRSRDLGRPAPPATQSAVPTSARKDAEGGPIIPTQPSANERARLKERISNLEKQLAETESKMSRSQQPTSAATTNPPPTPTTSTGSQLRQDVGSLKEGMASATNAITTMMESMHDIVDSLNSLQDEVSGLSTQQTAFLTALPPPNPQQQQQQQQQQPQQPPPPAAPNLDTILQPLQTLTETVALLREEVSTLKSQPSPILPAQPPPSTGSLETLLCQQTTRIDALSHQLTKLSTHLARQPPLTIGIGNNQQQQPPQTLRQAMAAAGRDLAAHLVHVERFYHQLDGAAGRAATERTAELMAALEEGVRAAREGAEGV